MACFNGKTDATLGERVKSHLESLGLETVVKTPMPGVAHDKLKAGVLGFQQAMGLDVFDPSIADTPNRVADMYVEELCYGLNYANFPKATTTPNGQEVLDKVNMEIFVSGRLEAWKDTKNEMTAAEYLENNPHVVDTFKSMRGKVDEMVMVDTIQVTSLCEHHWQGIYGVAHIAYIPGEQLLGLSKFARVVNFFARRPQVQERMTEQIYAALSFILGTDDIAVQVVATHNCMRARGAMDPHSKTTTSKMGGRFMSQNALRAEFLSSIPKVTV